MNVLYPPAFSVTFLGTNPIYRDLFWGAGSVAPHAVTDRIQYNILAGKRGIITNIFLYIKRQTVATTAGEVQLFVMLNYGPGQHSVARLETLNNTAGVNVVQINPAQIFVPAGTVVWCDSYDGSTGGTNMYICTINLVEVDQ